MLLNLQSCGNFLYQKQLRLLYKNTVPVISPEKLATIIQQKEPVYLLDTRSAREYEVSHLAGAQFVDYESFEINQVRDIPREAEVVVYCAVGVRSERVGEKLKEAGYTGVKNLYGGIFAWKNRGFPVVNRAQEVTDQVHTYNRYWAVWLQKGVKVYE